MKKAISILFICLSFFFSFSYKVELPNWWTDVKVENSISSNDNYYVNLSKTINKYLWYAMGVVSFAMLIYAGILLISSKWDPQDLKKWTRILVWWLVGIFVSVFAYNIINLLINLF